MNDIRTTMNVERYFINDKGEKIILKSFGFSGPDIHGDLYDYLQEAMNKLQDTKE